MIRNRLLLAAVLVTGLTIIAAPVSASAHSGKYSYKAKQQKRLCSKYDWKQARQFGRYDQNNRWQNHRIQNLINKENNRECEQTENTVDTLVNNGNFKTLTAAVGAAGLAETLKTGEFTVFAPTDQAFAKLPAGTVEALLADIPTLQSILTYHVVSGKVPASTAKTLPSATTVNGKSITITKKHGNLYINDSKVLLYDIKTSNGIIHVIDTVLIP